MFPASLSPARNAYDKEIAVSSTRIALYIGNELYPGTGEDPITATALSAVDVEILHGGGHPSALVLPTAAGA